MLIASVQLSETKKFSRIFIATKINIIACMQFFNPENKKFSKNCLHARNSRIILISVLKKINREADNEDR